MKLPLVLVLALFATNAHAVFNDSNPEPDWVQGLVSTGLADFTDYQIGNEWGKKPVSRDSLRGRNEAFSRTALATAHYGGATAFYLGKINGHHMMATNHHVMPNARICNSRSAIFPLLGKSYHCEKFYGDWTAIDLAFFSSTVPAGEDEAELAKIGRNFNFHTNLYAGQELLTIGYGIFRNSGRTLMANEDSDCKVFSEKADARFIADPDGINPADYKAWSFSTGCDVSHGDSGSAIVDRLTGDVVGIIWTTATQKPERIRDSSYLDQALKKQHADVWTWLSYAVPAAKMRDVLADLLSKGTFADADVAQTIQAIIQ